LETEKLTEEIIGALKEKRIAPSSLELEITESKLIKSKGSFRKNLNRLVDSGIVFSMDDFGTGYSSLNVLADYPFSTLKLDYNLIDGITSDIKKTFIAKTAIRMAHLLKIDIVAEGVENSQQYDMLQYMGCTTAQGFWISKPLPLDEFIDFIKRDIHYPGNAAGQLHMMFVDRLLWYRDLVYYAMSRLQKVNDTFSPLPIPSYKQCRFGEWFYKGGKTIGISSGIRIWQLEKYITSPQNNKDAHIVELNMSRWVLEVYRTIIETLQGIAWMLLVFFILALNAFVIVRVFELKRESKTTSE